MVSFTLFKLILLELLFEYGCSFTSLPDFRLGVIMEECFDKRQLFDEKFSYITKKTNITFRSTPCRDLKIAKAQMCALLRDGVTYFIALATRPVLGFYQAAFDTLATPINPNIEEKNEVTNIVGKVIVEVTREWNWQNLFMFVDNIFGDVVPRCTPRIAKIRPCHLAMVWTAEKTIQEFLDSTIAQTINSTTNQNSKQQYVIVLTHQHTIEFIHEANKRNMFNDRYEWLVVHPGTHHVLENFSVLTYDSNVFLMRLKSNDTFLRDIYEVRQTFRNQCGTTWQLVQRERVKEICNIDMTVSKTPDNDTEAEYGDFSFEVNEILATRLNQTPTLHLLGQWTHAGGYEYISSRPVPNFEGIELKVATLHTPPFVFVEPISDTENKFSGYLVDLLNITAERLNFSYKLISVADKEYGEEKNSSYWSGIIGAVQREEADLALANLTPIKKRAEAVRFLRAYVAVGGFELYYRKPTIYDETSKIGTYLRPFHHVTWISATSLMLFMTFVLSVSYEFNSFLRTKNSVKHQPQDEFRLRNFVFIATQVSAQQGVPYTPHGASARIVFFVIWFFSYMLFVSYSANLTSYFTASEVVLPIKNLEDALSQSEYKIGFKKGTSYLTMIRNDLASPEYMRLNNLISKDPTVVVETIENGFERAEKEKFVFAHDRGTLQWKASESCDFVVVGPTYMRVGVTLATNHRSPYYKGFNWAISALQENGILRRNQKSWFNRDSGCNLNNNEFKTVSIFTITGPFLCLSGGLAAALVVVIIENSSASCIKAKSNARSVSKMSPQGVIARKKLFELRVTYLCKRTPTARRKIFTARRSTPKKN